MPAEIYAYTFGIFVIGAGMGPFLMGVTYDTTHSYQVILTVLEAALAIACVSVPSYYRAMFTSRSGRASPEPMLREAAV